MPRDHSSECHNISDKLTNLSSAYSQAADVLGMDKLAEIIRQISSPGFHSVIDNIYDETGGKKFVK